MLREFWYAAAMNLPTESEITALHQRYAPTDEVLELVYVHCQIVWAVAEQLIEAGKLEVDKELVKVGCLLHDVGVHMLYDETGKERDLSKYITHGVLGEEILKAEGFSETIWRFASHHTGVGLSKADIEEQKLPLPHQDYVAETPEERLVMYADKFHSKDFTSNADSWFNSFDSYSKKLTKFGQEKVEDFKKLADEFGQPDLQELAKNFRQPIK